MSLIDINQPSEFSGIFRRITPKGVVKTEEDFLMKYKQLEYYTNLNVNEAEKNIEKDFES